MDKFITRRPSDHNLNPVKSPRPSASEQREKSPEPSTSRNPEPPSNEVSIDTDNELDVELVRRSRPSKRLNHETDSEEEVTEGPIKKKKYVQKFRQDWANKNRFKDWLEKNKNSDDAYCRACSKSLKGGQTHLERHEKSAFHQKRMAALKNTPCLPQVINQAAKGELKFTNLVKEAEIKLVMAITEHNLPLSLLEHLPKLIGSMCPDSEIAKKIACSRTKGTNIVVNTLGPKSLQDIIEKMQKNPFSLIIDETTDISTSKCLAVVVRYFDDDILDVRDRFLTMIEVQSCSAQDIFQSISDFLIKNGLPLVSSKMIGFAADNCSVMMGNQNGVQAKFADVVPNIFVMGCVCHSFHLCASAACLKLPRSIEDLARDIYSYFSHSSKRLALFKECQIYANVKVHKLLRPSQTRWLSLQAVVDRIKEQWASLTLFFTSAALEDNLVAAQTILNSLNNDVFKLYFCFLSYILDLVNKLNVEFQGQRPKLHLLLPTISATYRVILKSYMKRAYIDKTPLHLVDPSKREMFLSVDDMYLGAESEVLLSKNTIHRHDVTNVRLKCLEFYVELCLQIKRRVRFNDPVLSWMPNLDPQVALSGDISSIVPMATQFPNLIEINKVEALNSEWRLLPELKSESVTDERDFVRFWVGVRKIKNGLGELMFPNLSAFVLALGCLPHSSAAAERVFSQLNLIKTKTRNRLHVKTCNALMSSKELLGKHKCFSWVPPKDLLSKQTNEVVETGDDGDTFEDIILEDI